MHCKSSFGLALSALIIALTGCGNNAPAEPQATERAYTALFEAAQQGQWFVVESAIAERVIDVNTTDEQGRTLMHLAAAANQRGIILELLYTEEADPNIRDAQGKTPLDYANERGYTDIANILREHGAVD